MNKNKTNDQPKIAIFFGGAQESKISEISMSYLKAAALSLGINPIIIKIDEKNSLWHDGHKCTLAENGLVIDNKFYTIDYAIPCIHGHPGETGFIQVLFDFYNINYMGASFEASQLCFNKASTKLWAEKFSIKTTPFIIISKLSDTEIKKAELFYETYGDVFIKSATQGSSIGCYKVLKNNKEELHEAIHKSFDFGEYVLVEKFIKVRELEVSAYEHNGKLIVSPPGEILTDGSFYDYNEKYSKSSKVETDISAKNLPDNIIQSIEEISKKIFSLFKLKDLARIDFFLKESGELLLNEINTFPGLTEISMFPKMMEENGLPFNQYIENCIFRSRNENHSNDIK